MSNPVVVLETNQGVWQKGVIEVTLKPDVAPKACENFLALVEKGYFNDIIFHRVIKGFMIQTGDPTGTGLGGDSIWGKSFEDEIRSDVKFDKPGIMAMANSGPNSNKSQFFITTAPTPWLNMKHTIFGEVTAGYNVVQDIENCPTGEHDRPLTEHKIMKAFVKAA